jgi:hypothetical protein
MNSQIKQYNSLLLVINETATVRTLLGDITNICITNFNHIN